MASKVFALLGDPVEHSLSPRIHNAAFRALGLDAEYRAIRCDAPEVPALMRSLATAGGGGNVTVPHKAVDDVSANDSNARSSGSLSFLRRD